MKSEFNSNDEKYSDLIDKFQELMDEYQSKCSMQDFCDLVLFQLAYVIYNSSPSIKDADTLINKVLKDARELNKEQREKRKN